MDKLILIPEYLGQFSVKTAYFVSKKLLGKEVAEVEFRSPIWKLLWSPKVLPKIKYCMWRTLWAFSPPMDILHSRRLVVDRTCCVCGVKEESIFHTFFECEFELRV